MRYVLRLLPIRRLPCRALGALLLAALLLSPAAPLEARGASAQPARPKRISDPVLGQKLFDDCIRWVSANSQSGIQTVQDFYVKLDAELDLDTARHKGPMRVWWKTNDNFRWELTGISTKILQVNRQSNPPRPRMWIIQRGQVKRMHGTPDGAKAIPQLQEDASRLGDLAQFITLRELKGQGVTFTYEGPTDGTPNTIYAGKWLKVVRRIAGAGNIVFYLAYSRDAAGNLTASWPGIIRVDGVAGRYPTEDYILRNWANSPAGQPRSFRFPKQIAAYSFMPGSGKAPVRFLRATVQDIKINAGIDATRFQPPARVVRRGGG